MCYVWTIGMLKMDNLPYGYLYTGERFAAAALTVYEVTVSLSLGLRPVWPWTVTVPNSVKAWLSLIWLVCGVRPLRMLPLLRVRPSNSRPPGSRTRPSGSPSLSDRAASSWLLVVSSIPWPRTGDSGTISMIREKGHCHAENTRDRQGATSLDSVVGKAYRSVEVILQWEVNNDVRNIYSLSNVVKSLKHQRFQAFVNNVEQDGVRCSGRSRSNWLPISNQTWNYWRNTIIILSHDTLSDTTDFTMQNDNDCPAWARSLYTLR